MAVWIRATDFVKRLPHSLEQQARVATKNYSSNIDPELADRLSPDMADTYSKLAKGGKKVTTSQLAEKMTDTREGAIKELAGNAWLSIAESKGLTPSEKKAYDALRAQMKGSEDYENALEDPFPRGRAEHYLFFERHLPMVRKRAIVNAFESAKVFERLPKLAERVKDGLSKLPDGTKLRLEKKPTFDGKTPIQYPGHSDKPYLVLERPEGVTVLSNFDKRVDGKFFKTPNEYTSKSLQYEERSSFEQLMELAGLSPDIAKKLGLKKKKNEESEAKRINDRMQGGTYFEIASSIALTVDAAYNRGKRAGSLKKTFAKAQARQTELTGQYMAKKDAVATFQKIAELVKDEEVETGDCDMTIRIGKTLTTTVWDDDDNESEKTLVKGKGDLLIFDNHAGSVDLALSMSALKKGEIDGYVFSDDGAGRLRVGADGKAKEIADFRAMYSIMFSMENSLGAIAYARGE